ncbi:hypothetical protein Tco_1140692, partial [Tanacetum coccineum]
EEQPLPVAASPTAQSPDYVPESDLEADPDEDDEEDPEEDPVNYPADGGDDGDDKEGSSEDDEDDDMDIKADDDEEEEEHPAPADFVVVALPATDQAPSAEETEPFETDESVATPPPHPAYRMTTRISIPAPVPTPVWSNAEVARLLTISTLPSSPLSPWSSPLPQIPSPPLLVSPPLPVSSLVPVLSLSPPASPIHLLGYRAAMIRLRAEAASTSYLLPLPPPLHLLSTDRKEDRPESSSAAAARPAGALRADYAFIATMDREIRHDPERDDTDEIYTRLDDEQSQRQLLAGRLNVLFRDRRAYAHTCFLTETKARMSRVAWVGSIGASDLARAEVMSLRPTMLAQRRQRQLTKALKLVKSLQTQMADLLSITGSIPASMALENGTKKSHKVNTSHNVRALPKRATRSTTTTSVTNAQLKALIDQGVADALAVRNADRSMNGDDNHNSSTGVRR